jgi:hypothetical protein
MGNCNAKSKYSAGANNDLMTGSLSEDLLPAWHEGAILGMGAIYDATAGIPFVSCGDDKRVMICSDSAAALITRQKSDCDSHTPHGDGNGRKPSIAYGIAHTNAVNRVAASKRFVYSVSRDLSLRQVSSPC